MTSIHVERQGQAGKTPVVFAHGWARTFEDFVPVAELLGDAADIYLLDFPGFGQSPLPEAAWDTQQYAEAVKTHLAAEFGLSDFIWVGHSFGGRVGLRLAAMDDSPVSDLFVVAGAGVKRPRPLAARLKGKWNSAKFKRAKAQATSEAELIALEKQFGSADYVQSREIGMREIFVKTVNEDQLPDLPKIQCPTTLIYGGKDTETPPEIGKIMRDAIPNATYLECPHFDHISILSRGRHQITTLLLETLAAKDSARQAEALT